MLEKIKEIFKYIVYLKESFQTIQSVRNYLIKYIRIRDLLIRDIN